MRRFEAACLGGFAAALLLGRSGAAAAQPLDLMPAPAHVAVAPGRLPVQTGFSVALPGWSDARLRGAISRALSAWEARTGLRFAGAGPARLVVACRGSGPRWPALGEDESYTLDIDADRAVLSAATDVGALRGLATLQQLLRRDAAGWYLPCVGVRDAPRFAWRGLLVDVARHWEPPGVLRRTLDGMALVKLNVLHLHLTDDQGFRIQIRSHPELTADGSDGEFYTQAEMRALIAYAADRGIRIVPEFDLPAHTASWLVSHPEVGSAPGPYRMERHWGVNDQVMDPTIPATYRLVADVLREMAALFPDPYLHVGGDENNGVDWSANPRIQAFIRDHHLDGNAGLQAWFEQRIEGIVAGLGKRMVGWDEVLQPGLPKSAVIESWRGSAALARAAALGYDGILAHGFYIDTCFPAAVYYRTALPRYGGHVLGGEATMWGEWVCPDTIDSRIWPATAAIAERLWSPANVRDVPDMYRRLATVDRRLEEIGLHQVSYRRPLEARLLGGTGSAAEAAAVSVFIDAIEPVTGYQRHRQQPTHDQWTPLIGVADAARPDSPARLVFAPAVERLLSAPADRRSDAAEQVRATLLAWWNAGQALAGPHGICSRAPGLAPAAPLAAQLADGADVGLRALDALQSGQALSPSWRRTATVRLALDGEPHDAVQIGAALHAIERLVAAAAPGPFPTSMLDGNPDLSLHSSPSGKN